MTSFTAPPESVHSAADWSSAVLAPLSDQESQNAEFTSKDRIQFYSDNASDYDKDMMKYSFK